MQSLLTQTYPNIEIILVDDGSSDKSPELCDRLSEEHQTLHTIHEPNSGVSVARNNGLEQARGAWISFIDSDDYIASTYIETLFQAAASHDCALACVPGGHDFRDGDICTLATPNGADLSSVVYNDVDFLRMMLYQQVTTGVQWRLYRRDILGNNPFPTGIVIGEDLASTYKFVHNAGKLVLVPNRELYAYRQRRESLVRQDFNPAKAKSAIRVSRQLYSDVSRIWPDLTNAAASRCFSICRTVFAQVPTDADDSESNRCRTELWAVISKYRQAVLFDRQARTRERLAAAIAFLGIGPFTLFCRACRKTGLMQ